MTARNISARRVAGQFALTTFYASVAFSYFRDHHYCVMAVNGPSMAPLLSPTFHGTAIKDRVLFKQDYPHKDLERGMIVSFLSPPSSQTAVKRIIALEGDTVKLLPRRTRANDARSPSSLYDDEVESIIVPYGHVWVEGDQVDRRQTWDSNDYGPISKSLIIGVGTRIVWPYSRSGKIDWKAGWEEQCAGRITRAPANYARPAEWKSYTLQGDEIE